MAREITKFQFETIKAQLEAGNENWLDLRRSCGLTNDELLEIVNNFDYYEKKFRDYSPKEPVKEDKPWWKFWER